MKTSKEIRTNHPVKITAIQLGVTYKELAELTGYSEGAFRNAVNKNEISLPMKKALELLKQSFENKMAKNDFMDLGKKLQSLRKLLKLNQTEFGERIGISKSAIASYENGYNPLPDYVIQSISAKFNISSEFFSDESIDVNNLSKSLIERNIVNIEFFNDISNFIDKKNAKKIALPYDFFTFLFPFAPNKKYYMARWSGDSILVFDDEQKVLNDDDCQVLVVNDDLIFTGVYDYKEGVVKIKDQTFSDNTKIEKWNFWAVYKYKIKGDILKLSDLKR